MTNDELKNTYFEWMCQLVSNDGQPSYRKLLIQLHSMDFNYSIPMDGNRAGDGVNLRYRFGYENGYKDSVIAACLDSRPCSVLEMMVALALRCEEDIMENTDNGIQPGRWFWEMIESLKLSEMSDKRFDLRYVRDRIDIFLNREYERDGEGGLFTIRQCRYDLRSVDIWYQMSYYLNDYLKKGDDMMKC